MRDSSPAGRAVLAFAALAALPASRIAAADPPAGASVGLAFREVSRAWGLDFRHHTGAAGEFYMIETMGSGIVVFDFDGDGDEDLFFVDSGSRPDHPGEARSTLFRNDGPGRFVDATARSGLSLAAYGMGAVAGDVEGDGDLDLYVTAFGGNQLFENGGDGTFRDATGRTGTGEASWSSSATFADFDRDGDLDLYVANYVDFAYGNNPVCGLERRGLRSYCHPTAFRGLPDRYFRNRGDGTFEEATAAAGVGADAGNGLGVVASDLDGDGWPDLLVANDMTPNFLFRNRGDGTFEEAALLSGVALSDLGKAEAGMGVEVADLDGDGPADVVVTHLDLETTGVYFGLGGGLFRDGRYQSGLAEPSMHRVGFGVVAADFDHDGDPDVAVANGHIIHNVEQWGTGTTYRQPNQLFENLGGGRFREVPGAMPAVRASRGLAAGDLDGDGDLDLAISNSGEAAEVYENLGASGRWLQVDLAGRGGNTAAVGARVEIEAGGARRWREARTASSYQSQHALSLHFGLGGAARVERLAVVWPDGRRQEIRDLPASRRIRIVAGEELPAAQPTPAFREVSEAWGLAFRHHHGGSGERHIVETMGSGVVVFDYDGDGDPDVLFLDGAPLPGYRGEAPRSRLFRNDGGGRFVEATEGARLAVAGYAMGGTAGDADGDGDLDLFVTCFGPDLYFANQGDGTFREATAEAGLGDPRWGASATFFDADGDGDLDLYLTNYLDFSLERPVRCHDERLGVDSTCHPDRFAPLPHRFYRNLGGGRFADATAEAGLSGAIGKGLGVVAADLDGDGRPDLYVANDTTPNFLFRNAGGGRFEDVSLLSGTALGDRGEAEAGMGIAVGDVDGNGLPDLVVTNFDLETNALYRNLGQGLFVDARYAANLAEASIGPLGFGTALADFDGDGWEDLVVANGHVLDNAERFGAGLAYRQANQLFWNREGRFELAATSGLEVVRASRGLAVGDLDGDGDLDLAISNSNDLAEVYENRLGQGRRWIAVEPAAGPPNRFALGAKVEVEAGGGRQFRQRLAASSYLSQSASTLHFGLGDAGRVERLTVRWPGGRSLRVVRVPVDLVLVVPSPEGGAG